MPVVRGSRNAYWIVGGLVAAVICCALIFWQLVRNFGFVTAFIPVEIDARANPNYGKGPVRLAAAKDQYDRWVALADAAMWQVDQKNLPEATKLAEELLGMAPKYEKDWNYGNAIHKANLVLGRVALQRNEVQKAKGLLLAAGSTRGSPQLDTFGPNMILAKELLQRGEKQVVLEYLDLCEKFWKMDSGAMSAWRYMIQNDRMPNFGARLLY